MTDKEILKAFEKSRKAEICKAVIRPKFTMYKELLQLVIAAAVLITVICLHLHFSGTVYTAVLCVTITLFVLSQTKKHPSYAYFPVSKMHSETDTFSMLVSAELLGIYAAVYNQVRSVPRRKKRLQQASQMPSAQRRIRRALIGR